ncbi:MAG: hypothetical protein CUN56_01055 [Phototrophicales bacterium]|nr:MAG: hypothetical protein CUN56_01055 [Phototrophicales bacterium]RMG77576.1 MAG: hypothetical protein D6711_01305 [Chloroflexota bacterium]
MRWLWCLFFLAACATSDAPVTPEKRYSAWGEVIPLAEAQQVDAPALLLNVQDLSIAWLTTTPVDTYHTINGTLLTIPTTDPYHQTLYPADNAFKHLIWLDAAVDGDGMRIWSAWISPQETTERGPIPVSDRPSYRYAVLPMPDQSLWLVWSGDLPGEPNLYSQFIDNHGRNRLPQRITSDADYPAFAGNHLYWINVLNNTVHQADFTNGVIDNERELVQIPELYLGDWLLNFQVGQDQTHTYLVWNIQRASGNVETWFSAGTGDDWMSPTRLGINPQPQTRFETGFNGGSALTAVNGDVWLSWAAVLPGQFSHFVMAAQAGNQLGVVYLKAGQVVGWQSVVTLELGLIGTPQLRTDRNLHLYLTWVDTDGYLNLTTTHPEIQHDMTRWFLPR